MKKSLKALLFILMFMLLSSTGIFGTEKIAEGSEGTIKLTIGQKDYYLGSVQMKTDAAPYIKSLASGGGRTMVPVAYVAPALGTEAPIWYPDERLVRIKKGPKEIEIAIDSSVLLVNGKSMQMDVAAEIKNIGSGGGRTMLPIAFIARALEVGYEWDGLTNTVKFYGYTKDYDQKGIYGPDTGTKTIEGNVVIKADGVVLQNIIIMGNLIITEEVGDGDVTLNNIIVRGDTFVRGGGKDSIHINGGQYSSVTIQNVEGQVRVVATDVNGLELVITEDAAGEEIILEGEFDSVIVEAENTNITTQGDTTIGELKVGDKGKNSTITVNSGTVVNKMILDGKSEVKGKGSVKEAEVNSDGVTFEKEPEKQTGSQPAQIQPTPSSSGSEGSDSSGGSENVTSATLQSPNVFNINAPAAVTSAVTLNDATVLTGVSSGGSALTETTHYTYAGGILTITQTYLESLNANAGDEIIITVTFDVGNPANLVIKAETGLNLWAQRESGTTENIRDIVRGEGTFVAISGSKSIKSTDGVNWTVQDFALGGEVRELTSIAYGYDKFMAVGGSSAFASEDGNTWVYNIGTLYSDLGSIAFGQLQDGSEVFVAGGFNNGLNGNDPEGVLQYCPNGVNWMAQNPIGINFGITDIAFGNGEFAALAGPNIITYDGISPYAINASEQYSCISYGNGIYVAAGQGIYTSIDAVNWTKVLETDKSFNRIIYGNGMFAAVGSGGALMTSANGSNWSEWDTGVDADLFGAAFGNNSLVIVGEGGLIIQSGSLAVAPIIAVANDGAIIEGAETNEVLTVTLNHDTFIAGQINTGNITITNLPASITVGSVAYDGPNVIRITLSGNSTADYDVDVTGTVHIAAAALENSIEELIRQIDFTAVVEADLAAPTNLVVDDEANTFDWTYNEQQSQPGDYEYSVDSGNSWTTCTAKPQPGITGNYAAGEVRVRAKATLRNPASAALVSTAPFTAITSAILGSPKYFNINAPAAVTSTVTLNDATALTGVSSGGSALIETTHYTYAGGILTITQTYLESLNANAGDEIIITVTFDMGNPANLVIKAETGLSLWTQRESGTTENIRDIVRGEGTFIAISGSEALKSTGGVNWTVQGFALGGECPLGGTVRELTSIAYGYDKFMAVGGSSAFASEDGTTWVYNIATYLSDLGSMAFGQLQDGSEVFVAGGFNNELNGNDPEGVLQYCPNGVNWMAQNPIGINFGITDIAFGNGEFAALAGPNIIIYDGISPYAINASEQYSCISYGNGIYVAAGQGIYTSIDAVNWTKVLETDKSFNRIIYGNGMFAAVGSGGALMTSANGSNWSEWDTGVDADLFGAAFGNNSLVIVGEGGLIIESGQI